MSLLKTQGYSCGGQGLFSHIANGQKSDESGLWGDLSVSVSSQLYFLFLASTVIQENLVGIISNHDSLSGSPSCHE